MSEKKERIILDVAYQPQIRIARDTTWLMLTVIIALLPSVAVAVFQFGLRPMITVLISAASCVFFEWGYRKLMKKSSSVGDLSAVVTGMLLAMVLPVNVPLFIPVVGAFFAIVIVKQLYGGIGKNFLNPALAGRAFLLACYAVTLGVWNTPKGLLMDVDAATMATPLSYLYGGSALPEYYSKLNLFIGNRPGCIGDLSILAALLGAAVLLIGKVIDWRIPASTIGTVALHTLIFGKEGYGNVDWMEYNLLSGGLVFAAFFMATDYSTSPVTAWGRVIYGFGIGAITVLIRYFGGYPEGVSYAILIMNLCSWAIDKACHRHQFGATKEDIAAEKAAAKGAD